MRLAAQVVAGQPLDSNKSIALLLLLLLLATLIQVSSSQNRPSFEEFNPASHSRHKSNQDQYQSDSEFTGISNRKWAQRAEAPGATAQRLAGSESVGQWAEQSWALFQDQTQDGKRNGNRDQDRSGVSSEESLNDENSTEKRREPTRAHNQNNLIISQTGIRSITRETQLEEEQQEIQRARRETNISRQQQQQSFQAEMSAAQVSRRRRWRNSDQTSAILKSAGESPTMIGSPPDQTTLLNAAANNQTSSTPYEDEAEANQTAKVVGVPESELKCRVEQDLYLDFEEYRHYTCANCYNQVPQKFFNNKLALIGDPPLARFRDIETEELIWSNESERIRLTFKNEGKFHKWRLCCREAVECCLANANYLPTTRNSIGQLVDDPSHLNKCPATWDGLSCWPPSEAGQVAWQTCPQVAYLLNFEPSCRGYVTKQCFPNASWFINPNGHEWSDYSTCNPEWLYETRMLHASIAYVGEALFVIPALLIIGKFPNRRGNKRIKIMKSLLLYILLSCLIQTCQRGLLAAGYFEKFRAVSMRYDNYRRDLQRAGAPPLDDSPLDEQQALIQPSNDNQRPYQVEISATNEAGLLDFEHLNLVTARSNEFTSVNSDATKSSDNHNTDRADAEKALISHIFKPSDVKKYESRFDEAKQNVQLEVARQDHVKWDQAGNLHECDSDSDTKSWSLKLANKVKPNVMMSNEGSKSAKVSQPARLQKRDSTPSASSGLSQIQSGKPFWSGIFCWLLQMANRLVRLMGYAWMFTGGVYLCSALHFAPAEPPLKFIRVLFFFTNAFPHLIFFTYVIARTMVEPSPLNILFQAPYYWFKGDNEAIEYLYATQVVCWFESSNSNGIEKIVDIPNFMLVGANVVLFLATLFILCRMNRPGSTRTDMSPCAYFKAAGTLLFLYGGHYSFLAHRPRSKYCSIDTLIFYAFICIDVIQGIAISIVFCYITQEGRAVIKNCWRNRQRLVLIRQFPWLGCIRDKDKFAESGYHHSSQNPHNRSNRSTRSSSGCNGNNDNVTELIHINDTQIPEQF